MSKEGNFTNKQLKISYWYVIHKLLLRKIGIIILIFFDFILVAYSGYGVVKYFVIEAKSYQAMLNNISQEIIDYKGYQVKNSSREIQVSNIEVISIGGGKYDLVAQVRNSNEKWLLESFDYKFIISGSETPLKRSFILPNETKYLIDLAVPSTQSITQASLEIQNIKWQRISPRPIAEYEKYKSEHLNFIIEDTNYISERDLAISDKIPVSRVTFKVKNQSAYNFWEVGFYVMLYKNNQLVGANYVVQDEFFSAEERDISVTWYERLPSVNQVVIEPEVNILDPETYLEFESGVGEPK